MGDNSGWIKLYRSIAYNELWEEKPFSAGQAWIDLLLMANHEDKKVVFDGNLIVVERGQRITSIRKLCEAWGWSNSKVVKFLNVLEMDQMITRKSDTKKTLITVVNYDIYQNTDTEKRQKNDTETTQKRHRNTQTRIIKNEKNINNIVDKPQRTFVPPTLEEVKDYCEGRHNNVNPERFIDYYTSNGWKVGKNNMKDWKAAVRTWENRDRGKPRSEKIEVDSKFRDFLSQNEVVDFNT